MAISSHTTCNNSEITGCFIFSVLKYTKNDSDKLKVGWDSSSLLISP